MVAALRLCKKTYPVDLFEKEQSLESGKFLSPCEFIQTECICHTVSVIFSRITWHARLGLFSAYILLCRKKVKTGQDPIGILFKNPGAFKIATKTIKRRGDRN